MTDPDNRPPDGVDLSKQEPQDPAGFDPYRFGRPEHPIPAEYAPPGYTGPTYPSGPTGDPIYPSGPANPFNNPPGTPYGPPPGPQQPYQPYQPYQQPPGDPNRYGAPPPPPYSQYPQQRAGSGRAVASLVLGIASIVLCWLIFFDAVFVILGVIFGVLALNDTKNGRLGGRGVAIAGIVCSVIGAILCTILTALIVHAANQCGGLSNNGTSGFQQCVRDHI